MKIVVVEVFAKPEANFKDSINGSNWQQTKMIGQANSKKLI